MSITTSKIQVLPAVSDNTTFYLTGQPINNGLASSQYALTGLTFNPSSNTLNSNGYSVGYLNVPQNIQSSNYILSLTDQSKFIYLTLTTNTTNVYIPPIVSFPVGTAIAIVTNGAYTCNVIANSGVTMYLAGNTTGSTANTRLLAGYSMASLLNVGTNTWYINGIGIT